jgi:hypothetical protein
MPHDDHEAADHGIEPHESPVGAAVSTPSAVGSPFVPMAEEIDVPATGVELTPDPEGPPIPTLPELTLPHEPEFPIPWPGGKLPRLCRINLRAGCYRLAFRPKGSFSVFYGTMRVDEAGGKTTISGDLYRYLRFPYTSVERAQRLAAVRVRLAERVGSLSSAAAGAISTTIGPATLGPLPFDIPIYPRSRYHSYLKVTNVERPGLWTYGPCQLTLTAQQYVYTQPPTGSFNGSFPSPPGTRTVTIVLQQKAAPAGFTSSYLEGKLYENGVDQGTITMGWVSPFFRRATLEIDVLTGAVGPQPVGTDDFATIFAKAGWRLHVIRDQTNIPVPAGVNANACWSSANLHALMTTVRNPTTNLDSDWHMHLVVVPATMGCGRGVMYDSIGVPREGVASFCDDGYPTSDSSNFGAAANKKQRNVPRAFLRSATHEVVHGFNQIHQEQEAGADNSIMTTTPSVADILGGPTTGAPGVFPDNINLAMNDHVRHHLVHFPDIVVRPGGMTFGSGHSSTVPEADRYYFEPDELALTLDPVEPHIELAEPLELHWTLKNTSRHELPVPSDIGIDAQHAFVTVTDPRGQSKLMPSFIIRTDHVSIVPLEPGKGLKAETRVFWSSRGFAFAEPGKYIVEVRIVWIAEGTPLGVKASTDIWVNYPKTEADNEAAATLLHPEVGKYVALGGGDHLVDAVNRLQQVAELEGDGDQGAPRVLRGYEDLMPSPDKSVTRRSPRTSSKKPEKTRSTSPTRRGSS